MSFAGALKSLVRARRSVDFASLATLTPVSRKFGVDRGTPIDRYYIEQFLAQHQTLIAGSAIEVAEATYLRRFGAGRITRLAILHGGPLVEGRHSDMLCGDLTDHATLPERAFDCFVCTQTLNVIFDVPTAAAGCRHLLNPGGVLLGTVAGTSQISRFDADRWGDYWRFSPMAIEAVLQKTGFQDIEIAPFGNLVAAIALLQGVVVEDLPDPTLLDHHDPDYVVVTGFVARRPR